MCFVYFYLYRDADLFTFPLHVVARFLTGGDNQSPFSLSASGVISLLTPTLNHESPGVYHMVVKVRDGLVGNASAMVGSALVTIIVTDVNEVPLVQDQAFAVGENRAEGSLLGPEWSVADPDAGQQLTAKLCTSCAVCPDASGVCVPPAAEDVAPFVLLSRPCTNTSCSLLLQLKATSTPLNFEPREADPVYRLRVRVTDDGMIDGVSTGLLYSDLMVSVSVQDVNDVPLFVDSLSKPQLDSLSPGAAVQVGELSSVGSVVAMLAARDDDEALGQVLSFSLAHDNCFIPRPTKKFADGTGALVYLPAPFTGQAVLDVGLKDVSAAVMIVLSSSSASQLRTTGKGGLAARDSSSMYLIQVSSTGVVLFYCAPSCSKVLNQSASGLIAVIDHARDSTSELWLEWTANAGKTAGTLEIGVGNVLGDQAVLSYTGDFVDVEHLGVSGDGNFAPLVGSVCLLVLPSAQFTLVGDTLMTSAPFNFESRQYFGLKFLVSDSFVPSAYSTTIMFIEIVDENEPPSIFHVCELPSGLSAKEMTLMSAYALPPSPAGAYSCRFVDEGSAVGTLVGSPLSVDDVDEKDSLLNGGFTFSLTTQSPREMFQISSSGGQISVLREGLDHEDTVSNGWYVLGT